MTGNKLSIASDLERVDRHRIAPEEYDEIPELDENFFDRADLHEGGKLVRRGRPPSAQPKVAISIRLSQDVLERFKASGPGWQSRIDGVLKEWLAQHPGGP